MLCVDGCSCIYQSSMTKVTIPESVEHIGSYAFKEHLLYLKEMGIAKLLLCIVSQLPDPKEIVLGEFEMNGFLALLVWLIIALVVLLIVAEGLVVLAYLLVMVYNAYMKPYNIKSARNLPDGEVFEKEKKSVKSSAEYIEDILSLYEKPDVVKTRYRMGNNLYQRVNATREILNRNGIIRKIRLVSVGVEKTDKGQMFRKWDQGGKEWRAAEISAAMTEEYIESNSGRILLNNYYPSVRVRYSMSRRIKAEDRENANRKDKWGRKIEIKEPLYEGEKLKNCPSCGAELPDDLKDVVCPYCNSTIFSDYYDWQVESLEIEPKKPVLRGFIGWCIYIMNSKAISFGVNNKKKTKIVRFSENDFRQDVYESFLSDERADNLVDMWLGSMDIKSIKNTEKDTIINIRVPVYRIVLDGTQGSYTIKSDIRDVKAAFTRVRYPNRFRKEDAVVSAEKMCPTCGGAFTPDDKGNCKFCGTFLFMDNMKWRRI